MTIIVRDMWPSMFDHKETLKRKTAANEKQHVRKEQFNTSSYLLQQAIRHSISHLFSYFHLNLFSLLFFYQLQLMPLTKILGLISVLPNLCRSDEIVTPFLLTLICWYCKFFILQFSLPENVLCSVLRSAR